MKIGTMTAEEWARDVHKVIVHGENPVAILTALVERIHMETVHQCAQEWISTKQLNVIQAAVDKAREDRKAKRRAS